MFLAFFFIFFWSCCALFVHYLAVFECWQLFRRRPHLLLYIYSFSNVLFGFAASCCWLKVKIQSHLGVKLSYFNKLSDEIIL